MIEYHIVEQREQTVVVEMSFSAAHPFFDGHFETVKILPAVAQLVVVQHLATECWGIVTGFRQLKQVKFKAPITPDMPLVVRVERTQKATANEILFRFQSGEALKSSGRLVYES